MYVYLPIAEMAVSVLSLIALGCGVGILSGMLGISGGFLLTPILILMGIPSSIAVASQSAGVIATSTTGVMGHWRGGFVDFKMVVYIVIGGVMGSSFGVWLFSYLDKAGNLESTIKISYVVLLGIIGTFMFLELGRTKFKRRNATKIQKFHHHNIFHHLPFRTKFKKSRLYISVIPPIFIGFFIGVLSAVMGIGGGFMMVPAMIYLLGMHTSVVIGTSLFQTLFVSINTTFWQASVNNTVDFLLSLVLLTGGVVGALIGVRLSKYLKVEQLRFILALIVMAVAIKLFVDLLSIPLDIFSVVSGEASK